MTSPHHHLGTWGETLAARYLTQKGYRLLTRNWRTEHLEIDLVAEWFGELVFVEVKTRSTEEHYTALSAVDKEKRQHLLHAAHAYKAYHRLDQPYRFDIITLVGSPKAYTLRHYPRAFTPQSVVEE